MSSTGLSSAGFSALSGEGSTQTISAAAASRIAQSAGKSRSFPLRARPRAAKAKYAAAAAIRPSSTTRPKTDAPPVSRVGSALGSGAAVTTLVPGSPAGAGAAVSSGAGEGLLSAAMAASSAAMRSASRRAAVEYSV